MICMEKLSIFVSLYWLFEIKFTTTTTYVSPPVFFESVVQYNDVDMSYD